MVDQSDSVAVLRRLVYLNDTDDDDLVEAAIAELERRARIEARRDAYLSRFWPDDIRHLYDRGSHIVQVYDHDDHMVASGTGPDYHTALERALDAAGAP
jgi:hypothetical protein